MISRKATFIWIGALILIGVVLIAFLGFRNDFQKNISKLKNIQSNVFLSKYGDIEYLLIGEGQTILISHGITGGVDQGIWISNLNIGKNYRFLYISRFGYLKSSMPKEASAKLQASAYNELLGHLGIESVFIIGNSAGGPSAMSFAADYPKKCKGLILLSSHVPGAKISSPPKFVFKYDFVYWLVVKLSGKSLLKMFVPPAVMETMTKQEIDQTINDVFMAALPISKRSEGIFFDNEVSSPSVESMHFETIKPPTLIIHAIDDPAPPIKGARELLTTIPNSKLATYNGGHLLLHHEHEIQTVISNFILQTK
jgi:pimeloyl-ACP methyl ester carboxylesterase